MLRGYSARELVMNFSRLPLSKMERCVSGKIVHAVLRLKRSRSLGPFPVAKPCLECERLLVAHSNICRNLVNALLEQSVHRSDVEAEQSEKAIAEMEHRRAAARAALLEHAFRHRSNGYGR